jgi:gliding motility associated protien GldN
MNRIYLIGLFVAGMSVQSIGQTRPTTTTTNQTTTPAPDVASAVAQPVGNPSARPIPASDIMYRRTVWRVIDLREKQNRPMFSANREITKIIMDAVKKGELTAYKDDSLNKPLSLADYKKSLVKPGEEIVETEEDKQARIEADRQLAAIEAAKRRQQGKNYVPTVVESQAMGPIEYSPKDIKKLELKEDVVFDKKRSRMYYDIHAITLKVPNAVTGFDDVIGSFAYKDLVKVFRNHPNEAVWYNMQNDAQHKNLADAFELRLFSNYIKKVSNVNDDDLSLIHGGSQAAILASQRALEEFIEFESSLWSY